MIGTFGTETIHVPRARLVHEDGGTAEWRSKALRRYQRLTRRAEALIAAIGVRRDGQRVLLAHRNMGGESTAAWTTLLECMMRRGLEAPEFIIVDGAPGLEAALAALWPDVPVQRCTVHKHRNLLAPAGSARHLPTVRTGGT